MIKTPVCVYVCVFEFLCKCMYEVVCAYVLIRIQQEALLL